LGETVYWRKSIANTVRAELDLAVQINWISVIQCEGSSILATNCSAHEYLFSIHIYISSWEFLSLSWVKLGEYVVADSDVLWELCNSNP